MEIVDENSSIELVDDHYRALTAEEAEARRFHAEKLAALKAAEAFFDIQPIEHAVGGFRTVGNYHILKKSCCSRAS